MSKHRAHPKWMIRGILLLALPIALHAASPPPLINYQGVLRGAADEPLTGSHDMTFRFYDAETGGVEILLDRHLAANARAVTVDGGLFSVALGSGTVTDGSGPNTYTSLDAVFLDYDQVWLEVQIGQETLSPRTRVLATAYALNATNASSAEMLDGQPSTFYLNTSTAWQSKGGALRLQSPDISHSTLEAIHTGGTANAAGRFEDNAFSGRAWAAEGDRGMRASGSEYGAYFEQTDLFGSRAYLASENTGIRAYAGANGGSSAGRFYGTYDGMSHLAFLGNTGGSGVWGYGYPGGYFNTAWTGQAYLAYGDEGVHGYGTFVGGYFVDTDSSSWVRTAYSTYKVQGSGAVSFVQNHPYDKDKVIVYAAPEGDEVAVYTRGTGRLVKGGVRVRLGGTFELVANPDVGLSAHVTPIGDPVALAVVEKSTSEIVVRGPGGSSAEFDYIVWGLRIGFESQSIVQPKSAEARVPAMDDHEAHYRADPSLRRFNALERFKAMRSGRTWDDSVDLAHAKQLLDAVGVYDPRRDGLVPVQAPDASTRPESLPGGMAPREGQVPPPTPAVLPAAGAPPAVVPEPGADPAPATPIAVASVRSPWIDSLPASAAIGAGDVLVLDPLVAGAVKPCDDAADRTLVGVAAGPDIDGRVEVAIAKIHEVRVDADHGAIAPGDLLTTSSTPGAAMRATADGPGTILGKALEPLEAGIGTIRVLLMPR